MLSTYTVSRLTGGIRRRLARTVNVRSMVMRNKVPIISFTFDDAPLSSFQTGRAILSAHGARATYFVAMGLLGKQSAVGPIASLHELSSALERGEELGCHTYDHLDAWSVSATEFMQSVDRNQRALSAAIPGATFKTFAYPKRGPTAIVKGRLAGRFLCCRGGGQTYNTEVVDRNLVQACFLDSRTGITASSVEEVIKLNALNKGWLVFATHDISRQPSPYGCSPELLETVVEAAARSGALLLPMAEACERLLSPNV